MAAGTERVTATKAKRRHPHPANEPVPADRLRRVIGTRGKEAAGPPEMRRNKELIGSKQHQGGASRHADGERVRWRFGNRLQGRSRWRRATRASGRPRRRTRRQSCFDGKSLESVASLNFSEPNPRASAWRQSPDGHGIRPSGAQTACNTGFGPWLRVHKPGETLLDDGFARRGGNRPSTGTSGPYSLDTVKRFRPFARRRFRTSLPFLLLIRTRNPCARFRRRVLG
jgi:hypothetical protein